MNRFASVSTWLIAASCAHAADGLTLATHGGFLNVTPITDRVIRVAFGRDQSFFSHSSFAVLPQSPLPQGKWKLESRPSEWILTTAALKVYVDRKSSAVSFYDSMLLHYC